MKKKDKLDFNAIIESVAITNDIQKDLILEVILSTIKSECADILDISENEILVENDSKKHIEIYLLKQVVEENVDHDNILKIELNDLAKYKIKKGNLGDIVKVPFTIDELSRSNVRHLNNVILRKLKNIRKEIVFNEYKKKEGDIVRGTFLRRIDKNIILSLPNQAEGILHFSEQIFMEQFGPGDIVKCYIKSVFYNEKNFLNIELSRKDPHFIIKLFEREVKEMQSGIIKVKSIVRDAGKKTKLSVYSTSPEVEPVGACVGLYGNRIKAVMKEIKTERIDIIAYTDDIKQYITKALEPGKVIQVLLINEKEKEALAVVEDESYPLAIGRHGINVKLAASLTGWELSVRTRAQMEKHPEILKIFSNIDSLFQTQKEDINQLTDVDEALLVKLMNHGITTVSELYEMSVNEIGNIEGIDLESAKKIKSVLQDMVEVVEEEAPETDFVEDIEDNIGEGELEDDIKEEIQQVEYVVCPNCEYEFEYKGEESCPKCGIEFEVE